MISIEVNNGRKMDLIQDKSRELIRVVTDSRVDGISEGDMVMLINYYRYVKDNNVQCDFINPHGSESKDNSITCEYKSI